MFYKSNNFKGALYAIFSGIGYGVTGFFGANIIKNKMPIENMLLWRFLLAALLILPFILHKLRILFKKPRETLKLFALGFALFSSSTIFYFVSSYYIGTGLAMVLFFSYPAMVMVVQRLNGSIKKLHGKHYLSLLLLFVGAFLIADIHQSIFDLRGIAYALLAALIYTFYIIWTENMKFDSQISSFLVLFGAGIACAIASLHYETLIVPCNTHEILLILGMALFCTLLPIMFLIKALEYITPEKAAMLSVLEPIFVIGVGIAFLDEKVSISQLFGVLIMLIAAILIFIPNLSFHKTKSVRIK